MNEQQGMQETNQAEGSTEISCRGVGIGRGASWISEGFALFKQEPILWIAMFVVMMVIMGILGLIPIAGQLAANLLWPVLVGGIMAGCAALDDGDDLTFGYLFAGFDEKLKPLLGLGLAYLAIMVLIIIVMIALAAFMGLGIAAMMDLDPTAMQGGDEPPVIAILLFSLIMGGLMMPFIMATWFAPALVMLSGAGIVESLKLSFMGCLKNILPFVLYSIVFIPLFIVAVIPLGLGLLVLIPVMTLSVYAGYKDVYSAG